MNILAIETSCDDTCVAILKIENCLPRRKPKAFLWGKLKILSNIVSSQVKLHAKYGGVWPYLAKREHQKNLPIIFKKAIKKAKSPKIDLIAVTVGPGLEPCLWVGVNFAKDLAKKLNLPIVPINHIEAHIYANFLNSKYLILNTKYLFPAICLIVSGGHTQLILMKNFGNYKILGETRDDAAGECFDKVARILELGYPGGPAIAKLSKTSGTRRAGVKPKTYKIELPRPMIHQKNYDFSFAGLKTAVLYKVRDEKFLLKDKRYIQEMCFEAQQAIIDVLIYKTIIAAKNYKAKSIILGGGVAANEELRKQFKEAIKKQLPNTLYLIPEPSLCTDNAAMVAEAAYYQWLRRKKENWKNIVVDANLRLDYNPPTTLPPSVGP